jgi:hypothetical protein
VSLDTGADIENGTAGGFQPFDLPACIEQFGQRYQNFLDILRSQVDAVMRSNPIDVVAREQAIANGYEAAASYASMEHARLNEHMMDCAYDAYQTACEDCGLTDPSGLEEQHGFIFEVAAYAVRTIEMQSQRDVITMAQQIRDNGLRVDFNMRAGMSLPEATASVLVENATNPVFKFSDRLGRTYKSSKLIRDTARQNLIHAYNEIYMNTAFEAGHDTVQVTHPDPNYKWFGHEISIVSNDAGIPTYHEVRDEIFHPSSDARVTLEA